MRIFIALIDRFYILQSGTCLSVFHPISNKKTGALLQPRYIILLKGPLTFNL
jgi:hypothetical protein